MRLTSSPSRAKKQKAAGTHRIAGDVYEKLLRTLGATGIGLEAHESSMRRAYGLSLLEVVMEVASEAQRCGGDSNAEVDSRLTATLQAVCATSHFLEDEDAAIINAATDRAVNYIFVATTASAAAGGEPEEESFVDEGGEERPKARLSQAALSLLALLRVSKQPQEGIPSALEAMQEMHNRGMSLSAPLAGRLDLIMRRYGTARQKRRAVFLLAQVLNDNDNDNDNDQSNGGSDGNGGDETDVDWEQGDSSGKSGKNLGVEDLILRQMFGAPLRNKSEWNPAKQPSTNNEEKKGKKKGGGGNNASGSDGGSISAENSYLLLRHNLGMTPMLPSAASGGGQRHPSLQNSHEDVFQRVIALAARGRPLAALTELQSVDGRKKGDRMTVPYKVYLVLFRAMSAGGYSAKEVEELELAANPLDSLQWLLRSMARQGYKAKCTIMNFCLESFATAATSRLVQKGGNEATTRVCTEAIDFMEEMRDGWGGGLHPPVQPDLVSFSIVVKIMCRLKLFDQAAEVFDVMEQCGCPPNRVTYSTLIHGLSKAGDNNGAWEVMVKMTNKGITPHSIAIDGIVDGFVRSEEIKEAISFAQHAFNQYGSTPSPLKFCRLLRTAAAIINGEDELNRAVTVAEQLWKDDWRGDDRSTHPVLGHPAIKELLEEKGVLGFSSVRPFS